LLAQSLLPVTTFTCFLKKNSTYGGKLF
jgi:hypothetical protein